MNQAQKDAILDKAKEQVARICDVLEKKQDLVEIQIEKSKETFKKKDSEGKMFQNEITKQNLKRFSELEYLKNSPFFIRCEVTNIQTKEKSVLKFGKFGSSEDGIYSWVTPAAEIRFDDPGPVSYLRPDGEMEYLDLDEKDQYLISNKEIKFLSTESLGAPRELIFQEYFSDRKSGFMLPEIVAEMEKSQDVVIRANHLGPFLISGPAGSGKTTLALHRIAFLLQSPDLIDTYSSEKIIVFVQDTGTKEYFSALLPSLGIDDVLITTFSDWAFSILELKGIFSARIGHSEIEKDHYEYAKIEALREIKSDLPAKSGFELLETIYSPFQNHYQKKIFQNQKKDNIYDRIDLTILLMAKKQQDGILQIVQDYYIEQKNGQYRKKRGPIALKYSLILVDEFQNYLPEQLKLMKFCLNQQLKSMIYVGDLAQQVRIGTLRDFADINENIPAERKVIMHKVYRNTQNILHFIENLGYEITIPKEIAVGEPVSEVGDLDTFLEFKYIRNLIATKHFGTMGVLLKDDEKLALFDEEFEDDEKVHVMTIREAQGVEFDIVVLADVSRKDYANSKNDDLPAGLIEENIKINKDLIYVALTRAIKELHVIGKDKLSEILR